ncbi:hypothetical protein HPB48_006192 [Haemaphysalis longicornis]|uniref:Transmembrane protein n=1 Tax=Haemaphysalis longicornis TaxID=44386 RepID=A0A9J6FWC5_HAELO|nr:hypothetical protein HPB48_006192 [Haemaphysalis longicornis]
MVPPETSPLGHTVSSKDGLQHRNKRSARPRTSPTTVIAPRPGYSASLSSPPLRPDAASTGTTPPCPSLAVGSRGGARSLDLSQLLLRQLFSLRVPLRARNEVGFYFASSALFLVFFFLPAASSSSPPGVRGEASPWWRGWDDDPTDWKEQRRGESATLRSTAPPPGALQVFGTRRRPGGTWAKLLLLLFFLPPLPVLLPLIVAPIQEPKSNDGEVTWSSFLLSGLPCVYVMPFFPPRHHRRPAESSSWLPPPPADDLYPLPLPGASSWPSTAVPDTAVCVIEHGTAAASRFLVSPAA